MYSQNVFDGTEIPLTGTHERVIRLAGAGSDATEVSMSKTPEHFLPIYEDPRKVAHLIRKWSMDGSFPVVWKVGESKLWKPCSYSCRFAMVRMDIVILGQALASMKATC